MFKTASEPITIVVTDGRYDMFGPLTPRSKHLAKVLQRMGGVNESVDNGTYHFNVVRKGFRLSASLTRI